MTYEEFKNLDDVNKYFAGKDLFGITDEMRQKEFHTLLDEWKYEAGIYWEGITDEMRIQEFPKLSNKVKYKAGLCWKGITNKMRRKEFPNFSDTWKYWAGRDWKGITNEMRQKGMLEYIIKNNNYYTFHKYCLSSFCPFKEKDTCSLKSKEGAIKKYKELFGEKELFKILI